MLDHIKSCEVWTALMEAEFLQNIVNSTTTGHVDEDTGAEGENASIDFHAESEKEDSVGVLPTMASTISTEQWKLTVLEEDSPPDPTTAAVSGTSPQENESEMRTKKRKSAKRRKWKLRNDLPLDSFYQSAEDWNDLFLMRKLLGGKGEPSDREGDDTNSVESDHDGHDPKDSLEKEGELKYFDPPVTGRRIHRPVEEIVRRKVLESRRMQHGNRSDIDKEVTGSVHDDEIVKPEYDDFAGLVDETGQTVVQKTVFNFHKRKFEADKREARKLRKRAKIRVEKWYEKQPFDDPILEAKRLRALRAKMIHDKHRFDLENLKIDAKELAEENSRLKEKIRGLQEREASYLEQIKDKEATEARLKQLEREVELKRRDEESSDIGVNQIQGPKSVLLALQVCWNLF